jgi:hypothetical protein
MRNLLAKLRSDDRAAVVTMEWVLLVLVLVLGMVLGLCAIRQAIQTSASDVTNPPPGGAQSHGQGPSEYLTVGGQFKDASDPLVVKSTSAIPGGFGNRACD